MPAQPRRLVENPERGARIKSLREERGFTQPALAELVGVTYETIALWEKGHKVSYGKLVALAVALATTPEHLETGETRNGKPLSDDAKDALRRVETLLRGHDELARTHYSLVAKRWEALQALEEKVTEQLAAANEISESLLLEFRALRQAQGASVPSEEDERPPQSNPSKRPSADS